MENSGDYCLFGKDITVGISASEFNQVLGCESILICKVSELIISSADHNSDREIDLLDTILSNL